MAAAIGLWFYKLQPYPERGRTITKAPDLPGASFDAFLRDFVSANSTVKQDDERQRIWYFGKPKRQTNEIDGTIKYGTFGFESDLIDSKTKTHRYKREVADYEQIDLYFQFWWPENAPGALLTLQSFQGRSCIGFVNQALIEAFRAAYPGYTLRISKIMPESLRKSIFAHSPVKSISLVARQVHADRRRNYGSSQIPEEIDVSIRLSARKKGSFGPLGKINEGTLAKLSLPVWLVESKAFDRATAEIDWNGRRRKVGVFGYSGEAGSIDVTDDVKFGSNGHPKFSSLREHADDLLGSFAQALGFVAK